MTAEVLLAEREFTEGVAVVMPAYREEGNLEATVEDFLQTLEASGVAHCVVVVNDGSPDATGEVLDGLVERHPGRIIAVHHDRNRGYGAAVRTGISAAVERTELRWMLLTDSDGQFRAENLLAFMNVQREERADGVIGYRKDRADPLVRRINASLWTLASRLLLHTGSRDVDCAFKLLDRRLLTGVELAGEAAAISPELLAKVSVDQARIIEHPVDHYPRKNGESTGGNLTVILRSLVSLLRVYLDLVRDQRKWSRVRRLVRPADPVLAALTVGATAFSIGSYLYFRRQGVLLAYLDSISHVLIAKRVVASPTAGAAQLGGVWPPLPHLFSLPLVWMRSAYESGFASSVISMIAFVVTARYLYRIATAMAGSRFAGVVAAGLFITNLNALYLQSTPMTETLLLACIAAAVYHLHEWCQAGRYGQLGATSLAVLLATLTRYEGWVLCAAVTAVVVYTARRRWRGYTHIESHLIFFGVVAFGGIIGWLAWNGIIFGNPLNWQNGAYAKSSLWVSAADVAVGHPDVALRTYLYAMLHNIGLAALVLGAVGVGVHLYRTRLRAVSIAPYTLLVFLPFFVYAVYSGQRPLHVPEVDGYLYNVRFALVMVLASSVFAGYLAVEVSRLVGRALARRMGAAPVSAIPAAGRRQFVLQGVLATIVLAATLAVPGIPTLTEARSFRASATERANQTASAWLRNNYDGGLVLMQSWGNESVTFDSRIPTERILYEGSFRLWEPALADPARHGIRWIHLRYEPGKEDDVWRALNGRPTLVNDYTVVYRDKSRLIYRYRGDGPSVPQQNGQLSRPKGSGR